MNNQPEFSFSSEAFEILCKKSQAVIHSIVGPSRADIFPLAYSIAITAGRLYIQEIPLNMFTVYKDVYYETAKLLNQTHTAAARSIERMAKRISKIIIMQGNTEKYFGKAICEPITPRTLVIYLAAYVYFDKPYHQETMHPHDGTDPSNTAPDLPSVPLASPPIQSVTTPVIAIPPEKLHQARAHAEARSESVTGFIVRAIDETMERDNAAPAASQGDSEGVEKAEG